MSTSTVAHAARHSLRAAPRLRARDGARGGRPPHAALARRARASTPRRALVVAAAASDDVEPAPRDYTGELRMPPPVEQTPEVLPAMLFPADEVLLPGSTQVLHLYEARFLALLDEVTARTGGLFAHVTFLPPSPGAPIDEGLRVNQVATLVRVEEVQREEVGAKVTVIGESRLQLVDLRDSDPYVRAAFLAVPTMGAEGTLAYTPSEEEMAEVEALTEFIDTAVNDVVTLVDRLVGEDGADPESLWDISGAADDVEWGHAEVGNLRRAMAWVEGPSITLDDLDEPVSADEADWLAPMLEERVAHSELQLAERLSFACLQVAPASTEADLARLMSCRSIAMSTSHGLMDRLKLGQIVLDEQRSALRAKLALKSAFGGGGDAEDAGDAGDAGDVGDAGNGDGDVPGEGGTGTRGPD